MDDSSRPASRRRDPRAGFFWALSSVTVPAVVFFILPGLTARLGVWSTSVFWFLAATGFYLLLALLLGRLKSLVVPAGQRLKVVLLGLAQAAGTLLFFFALNRAEPGLVSFVGNLTPVLTTLGGLWLFRERFAGAQIAGGLLILLGAAMLTYYDESGSLTGILFMVAATIFYAVHGLLARNLTEKVDPLSLGFWRTALMTAFFIVVAVLLGELRPPDTGGDWLLLALGGLVGPLGSIYPFYLALERWDVSKASLVRGSLPVWVLLWGLLLNGALPEPMQLCGGGLTLLGTAMIFLFRRRSAETPAPVEVCHEGAAD